MALLKPRPLGRRSGLQMLGAGVLAALCMGAAPPSERFETPLSSVARDILTREVVAGAGRTTATLAGTVVTVAGTYQGLPSAATGAELRQGVATGVPGPTIAGLTVTGGQAGSITGAVTLKPDQVAALRAGRLYVQINSEKAADGNLWGWLLPLRASAGR